LLFSEQVENTEKTSGPNPAMRKQIPITILTPVPVETFVKE
jgi:hypothetical protein